MSQNRSHNGTARNCRIQIREPNGRILTNIPVTAACLRKVRRVARQQHQTIERFILDGIECALASLLAALSKRGGQ